MGTTTRVDEEEFSAEVDDRGRITIPVALRDRLGIRPGDVLAVDLESDRLILQPEGSDLLAVASGREEWDASAFPDSGEATFGGSGR